MKTVLLVDDEQPIRLIYRANLEPAGYKVMEAADGATALELAAKTPPDVALLDVLLPGMSGWTISAELARQEETRQTALVFLSALTAPAATLHELERLGIPYIEKSSLDPTTLPELLPKIIAAGRAADRDSRLAVLESLSPG